MKRALLVGIDYYDDRDFPPLSGCANDAAALHSLLARNEDNSPNLDCQIATATDRDSQLTRGQLLQMLDRLLAGGASFALLYFAGHGSSTNGGVALGTSDATAHTPGVAFSEVLTKVNNSTVSEITVILDCCFSGGATTLEALNNGLANLRKGLAVLTASRDDQPAMETAQGRGQFSTYLEAALQGGAADTLGHVNVANLYAYLSESFGAWEQRPTFKANVEALQDIRLCAPRLPLHELRKLTDWFPTPVAEFPLDPSYEPTAKEAIASHVAVFSALQRCRACQLVVPIDQEHMYYAAMRSTGCRLTPLGQRYWRLVDAGRI
ncbi:caspase family protein [Mycobacterium sp. 050134]|uniref:caspase family protein n=1 Tax=Mycobacterium sp. 050134 TaxID=3096111 RepID=UPI002ED8A0A2